MLRYPKEVGYEDDLLAAARASARLAKAVDRALAGVELSTPQYRLLAFLSGGPERATALACRLQVRPASLTALVDGAVARGLVVRVAAEDDRRGVGHRLTADGERALAAGDAAISSRLESVLSWLSPTEAGRALDGLRLVGQALDDARAQPVSP